MRRPAVLIASVSVVLALSLTACGDDDDPTPEEAFCDDAAALKTSVTSLADLDVVAEGTNGLETALGDVRSDLDSLSDSGSEVAADEIDALKSAVGDLEESVQAAGGELTADNASGVVSAVGAVGTSAQALNDKFATACE